MDWQVARWLGLSATRLSSASRLVVFALAVIAMVSVDAQERGSTAVRTWRPVGASAQGERAPSDAHSSRTPSAKRQPPVAQTGYAVMPHEELPYVGGYVEPYAGDSCDRFSPCPPDCGCGGADCCDEPLLMSGSSIGEIWISGDYLLWSISGSDLPPLVTSSSPGTAPENTGVLGQSSTRSLLGSDADDLTGSGFRVAGGWWFDAAKSAGLEFSYAGLPSQSERDRFTSSDYPLLARPVYDTATGTESAMLVAYPDLLSGEITVRSSAEFHHVGAIRRARLSQSRCRTVESLFGFRFASLEEELQIDQFSRFTQGTGQVIGGTTMDVLDRWETENRFYGLLLGLDIRERIGDWVFAARGSLSLGNTHAESVIDGRTVTTVPGGGSSTAVGGLLAQETNIGSASRNKFALMPELSLGLSTHLTRCWELHVGYHLLYWSNAARPGEQINRRVSQFPPEPPAGTMDPSRRFDYGDVLIHGLQTGLVYRF